MNAWSSQRGEGTSGALVAIALLVIALIAVVFLWMNDRSSQDASLEVDVGARPSQVSPLPARIA